MAGLEEKEKIVVSEIYDKKNAKFLKGCTANEFLNKVEIFSEQKFSMKRLNGLLESY